MILHLPPPVHGAAMMGQYIKESALMHQYFDADYVNLSTSHSLAGVEKINAGKFTNLLQIQWNIFKQLLRTNYKVCYVTMTTYGPGFYKDLLVVLVLRLFRKKIIYHFHNKGISRHTSWMGKLLCRFAYTGTSAILLSELLRYDVSPYFKQDNIFICANGIPEQSAKKENLVNSHTCRFLFLSNMMKEKGTLVLLEACRILKQQYKAKFECVFAGGWYDIPEEEFSSLIREADLEKELKFEGPVWGEKKNLLFSNADVFVFPTYYHNECFPLVLLEAMQHQLPVVSTFEGGIPDLIEQGKNGYLVPQRNAQQLAEKLYDLVTHPERRKEMGEAALRKYKEHYTLSRFEERLKQILLTAVTT